MGKYFGVGNDVPFEVYITPLDNEKTSLTISRLNCIIAYPAPAPRICAGCVFRYFSTALRDCL